MTDRDRRNTDPRAGTAALLRILVAGYLVYLGADLIRDRLLGASTLAAGTARVCGVLFIAAGVLFGVFTWRRWRAGGPSGDNSDDPADKGQQ